MKSLDNITNAIKFADEYEYCQVVLSLDNALEIKRDLLLLEKIGSFKDSDLDGDIENLIIECNDNDKWNIPISKFTLFLIQDKLRRYHRALELLEPVINLGDNVDFGGSDYYIADDRQLHYISSEDYYMIEDLMREIRK